MSTNKFLGSLNGISRLYTAINTSSGASDADKIVATASSGRLGNTLMPTVLEAIANATLTGNGYLRRNGGTWSLDTPTGTNLVAAWANIAVGTGTPTIRQSYNVSSVTDVAVGILTLNFTTALADANYAWTGSASIDSGSDTPYNLPLVGRRGVGQTASALTIHTSFAQGAVGTDFDTVSVIVVR